MAANSMSSNSNLVSTRPFLFCPSSIWSPMLPRLTGPLQGPQHAHAELAGISWLFWERVLEGVKCSCPHGGIHVYILCLKMPRQCDCKTENMKETLVLQNKQKQKQKCDCRTTNITGIMWLQNNKYYRSHVIAEIQTLEWSCDCRTTNIIVIM